MSKSELSLEKICELMPKVELHAHLNGSISDSIIRKLKLTKAIDTSTPSSNNDDRQEDGFHLSAKRQRRSVGDNETKDHHEEEDTIGLSVDATGQRTLAECWKVFEKIHELIRTPDILFQATCEVIEDFHRDNVIYLELRSSPKKIHDIPSKEIYIETVIAAIKHCRDVMKLPIVVKLLVSVDRATSARNYLENVCLAQWYRLHEPDIVVGLDLSGNPHKGNLKNIIFALNFAKRMGQRVSLHLPEIINEEETKAFLDYKPDRLAHGQFLHPATGGNDDLWKQFRESRICMESCITSNLISGVSQSLDDSSQYVTALYMDNIPFVISTDDSGVFRSNLSHEYKLFTQLTPISKKELREFCIRAPSFIFGDETEKSFLIAQIKDWWDGHVRLEEEEQK